MKKIKAPPGAKRLIESLRNMGYDCSTAVADVVDNSVAADSTDIRVELLQQYGSRPAAIMIADNGSGMDLDRLVEAMRLGAYQDYSDEDLGKYGLGLKTASLSQCRKLTVASKPRPSEGTRPRRHYARWDLDFVDETDDWDLLLPTPDELEPWEAELLHHEVAKEGGTVVLWTGLDEALPLLSEHDVNRRDRFLAQLMQEVGSHLRMVFHRFMEGTVDGRRTVQIYLNGERLRPWDPFCRHEETQELEVLTLTVSGQDRLGNDAKGTVTIRPFVLPPEGEFSSSSARKDAAGPRGWNQQQGFYFYRNYRLLQAGGWSWLRAVDEHTKLLRVAIHFPQKLDRAFDLNVTKMRARIPAEIREAVRGAVSKWVRIARDRYDSVGASKPKATKRAPPSAGGPAGGGTTRRGEAPTSATFGNLSLVLSNAPNHSLTVMEGALPGQVKIIVPHRHSAAQIFSMLNGDDGHRLCLALMTVLEAVYEQKMESEQIPIESLRRALSRLK